MKAARGRWRTAAVLAAAAARAAAVPDAVEQAARTHINAMPAWNAGDEFEGARQRALAEAPTH